MHLNLRGVRLHSVQKQPAKLVSRVELIEHVKEASSMI